MDSADLNARLALLEKDMASFKATFRAGLGVMIFMGCGYGWYASKSVDTLEKLSENFNLMRTDVLLIKKDNERRNWERQLIQQMIKKGATDVSSSQERD